ncbi:MAG: nucleotidyltransferase domain-containing protein [Nanoarchaeota archaeon]|nr:nucleotidyltransferase domain-containing protein [Nanoarchaeota archaeon]
MDNNLRIINHLGKHIKERFTMHQLSKLLHIPYASFYRAIQQMKDLLITEAVGKSKAISLNISNPVVKSYLTISSDEEKKEFLAKQPIIKKIANELNVKDIVMLFGSYAKGKETEKSDIDIMVISQDGKKSISFSKYELLFRKKINPVFVKKEEFRKMLNEREENVGKQALKDHVILNNPEGFWGCVLDAV